MTKKMKRGLILNPKQIRSSIVQLQITTYTVYSKNNGKDNNRLVTWYDDIHTKTEDNSKESIGIVTPGPVTLQRAP